MLSSFTMISVMGVMLGVLVLVVVMAVFSGLEREVKGRILGFTPHILVRNHMMEMGMNEEQWQQIVGSLGEVPGVESATPFVSDNVIIDIESWQRPALFRGIDTSDPTQVAGIQAMLDIAGHPDSTADMGLDDLAVISSTISEQYRIGVGTRIRLYSTRNFEEVMRVYKATERPVVREAFKSEWESVKAILECGWLNQEAPHRIPTKALAKAYETLDRIYAENIREPEHQSIESLLVTLGNGRRDEASGNHEFNAEDRDGIRQSIAQIDASDAEAMDAEILKGLKSFVLPKEVTVCGVYLSSQMAVTPDLFVPLHLAQDLAGLEDGSVQGIALRLDDPYDAEAVAAGARVQFGNLWSFMTWGEQYQAFFALISQQRLMMYFALSFIVLVSAFSMMAVMFTVTIQKRREIGVMKALGAAPGQIVRVFLYQGMLLGAVGALLGVALGHLVIHFRGALQVVLRSVGFDPFSASLTGFNTLPAHHEPVEQVLIALCAFLLCSLAALVPAFFAARSDAAKSLRNL